MLIINIPSVFLMVHAAVSVKLIVLLNSFVTHFDNYSGLKMQQAPYELPFSIFMLPTTEPVKVRVINHVNVTNMQRNHYG